MILDNIGAFFSTFIGAITKRIASKASPFLIEEGEAMLGYLKAGMDILLSSVPQDQKTILWQDWKTGFSIFVEATKREGNEIADDLLEILLQASSDQLFSVFE